MRGQFESKIYEEIGRDVLGENGSCDCDERREDRRVAVRSLQGVARGQEGDFRAGSDILWVLG